MGIREGVPVINMQKVEGLGEEIMEACEEWGCFRMLNHGIPKELMAEMKVVVASLFDLPTEIKMRTVSRVRGGGKGYIALNPVTPVLEGLSIDDISSPHEFCDNLETSPHQREVIYKYLKCIRDLAGLLGRKLNEHNGSTGDLFDEWTCRLRINKFHYTSESVGLTGVHVHSDPSFLTILQLDDEVNGLQVVDKYSGEFVPLDPVPGSMVVNVGLYSQEWSKGKFCSVKHRVWCHEAKTRYSIALFVEGPNDKNVEEPIDLKHDTQLDVPIDVDKYKQVPKLA